MKLPSTKTLMFNGAAVMIMGAAVVTQIKSFFHAPVTPHCSERYQKAVALGVERNGTLLTATDIQAAAAGNDHGVLDNLEIGRSPNAPRPVLLAVTMKKGTSHPEQARGAKGGMSFPWQPRALSGQVDAACLSYDLLLPADFDFGTGTGTLPGLAGTSAQLGAANGERFVVHGGWSNNGLMHLTSNLTAGQQQVGGGIGIDRTIPRGKWVRIDQEVVLNTPGQEDGALRLWLDGSLVGEVTNVVMRHSADTRIETVLAATHFGSSSAAVDGAAVKDERIQMTPFELRW